MTRPEGTSRRCFLAGAAGIVGAGLVVGTARDLLLTPAGAKASQPAIHPRSDWGQGLPAKGVLDAERDVKFLLVHHTAGANGYPATAVPATLRGIYSFHTGAKGWKDVAYNFFVDAHGGIWEGRTGSLEGPVVVDATGGSQGFAQLCCFMGDHQAIPPTEKAQAAMTDLLAWLAGRHDIDLTVGAKVTFRSRGSNLHPAGKQVITQTIAAHRDMSSTTCPGDACYRLVKGPLAAAAAAKAGVTGAAAVRTPAPVAEMAPTSSALPPAAPTAPEASLPEASPTEIGEDNPPPTTTTAPAAAPPVEVAGRQPEAESTPSSTGPALGLGGLGAAGAVAGVVLFRKRRSRAEAESRSYKAELLNPPTATPVQVPDPAPEALPEPAAPRSPFYRPEG